MNGVASESAEVDKEVSRAYETLLKCRETELNLHMARSNLCLVVEGALLAFVAPAILGLKPEPQLVEKIMPILLSLSGVAVSAICIPIVRGASFWVAYYEYRLSELESNVLPTIPIFRDHPSERNRERVGRLPPYLQYVSSRNAILLLFRLLTGFWVALSLFVLLGVGSRAPSIFSI